MCNANSDVPCITRALLLGTVAASFGSPRQYNHRLYTYALPSTQTEERVRVVCSIKAAVGFTLLMRVCCIGKSQRFIAGHCCMTCLQDEHVSYAFSHTQYAMVLQLHMAAAYSIDMHPCDGFRNL